MTLLRTWSHSFTVTGRVEEGGYNTTGCVGLKYLLLEQSIRLQLEGWRSRIVVNRCALPRPDMIRESEQALSRKKARTSTPRRGIYLPPSSGMRSQGRRITRFDSKATVRSTMQKTTGDADHTKGKRTVALRLTRVGPQLLSPSHHLVVVAEVKDPVPHVLRGGVDVLHSEGAAALTTILVRLALEHVLYLHGFNTSQRVVAMRGVIDAAVITRVLEGTVVRLARPGPQRLEESQEEARTSTVSGGKSRPSPSARPWRNYFTLLHDVVYAAPNCPRWGRRYACGYISSKHLQRYSEAPLEIRDKRTQIIRVRCRNALGWNRYVGLDVWESRHRASTLIPTPARCLSTFDKLKKITASDCTTRTTATVIKNSDGTTSISPCNMSASCTADKCSQTARVQHLNASALEGSPDLPR